MDIREEYKNIVNHTYTTELESEAYKHHQLSIELLEKMDIHPNKQQRISISNVFTDIKYNSYSNYINNLFNIYK